jgi:hypothetical protein
MTSIVSTDRVGTLLSYRRHLETERGKTMKRINERIESRRNRTPGKELQQEELGLAVGGGCCAQGCICPSLPGIGLPGPITKFP